MKRTRKVICIAASFVLALNFAAGLVFYLFEPESVRSDPAASAPFSSNNGVIYLDQSWFRIRPGHMVLDTAGNRRDVV
ncbi:MAG: hypothetical protein WB586_11165 [Chthoniobacterales bacterium]